MIAAQSVSRGGSRLGQYNEEGVSMPGVVSGVGGGVLGSEEQVAARSDDSPQPVLPMTSTTSGRGAETDDGDSDDDGVNLGGAGGAGAGPGGGDVSEGMGGYWRQHSRPSSPRMPPPEQPETRPKSRQEPAPPRYNNLGYWRARRVTFYKNGDPYFPGVEFRSVFK